MVKVFAAFFLIVGAGVGCTCSSAAPGATTDATPAAGQDAAIAAVPDALSWAQEALATPTEFAPGCLHPAVVETCAEGWCRIPAGCFLQGSPENESDRAMYGEELTAVTLTHAFLIQQHLVTQGEWVRFGGGGTGITLDPDSGISLDNCLEDNCPAGAVNLVEAMAYANFLSESSIPPLPPCFTLVDCKGPVSTVLTYPLGTNFDEMRMACAGFSVNAPSIYECEGFRLPTESEWEYAARAGSRTAFYSGDHEKNPDPLQRTMYEDPKLSPIAWYDWNSGNRTHHVMQKLPNAWGLYDVLGNEFELTYSNSVSDDFAGPMVDPLRPPTASHAVVGKGGPANGVPALHRAANRFPVEPNGLGAGFRLARTLKAGEVWPPGKAD
jgi:formylglycine-generating enzyme